MPEGRGDERGSNWGFEEIRMLLEVRAEEAVCDMVTGTSRDTQVYEQIQSRLATMGVVRSRRQITSKLKTLKSKFFKVKARYVFTTACCSISNSSRLRRCRSSSPPFPFFPFHHETNAALEHSELKYCDSFSAIPVE